LQRVTRSGEKKLPRGLGFVVVHAGLQGLNMGKLTVC
jgi:hypothetical protein